MNITFAAREPKWEKQNRYFKKSLKPLMIGFNISYLLFCLLPLSLIQFLPLLYIVLVVLKLINVLLSRRYQ